MCGRYIIDTDRDIEEMTRILSEINEKFKVEYNTGEIFPTNTAPVFVGSQGDLSPTLMQWGFPGFQNKGVVINARSETANEKRMFKGALQTRRCIIPTTGFYEWRQEEGASKKVKYLFNVAGSDMLYLAGLYQQGQTPAESKYVILTTAANESMRLYHHRMPVIVGSHAMKDWILDRDFAIDYLHKTPPALIAKLA